MILRPGERADWQELSSLLAAHGMEADLDPLEFLVAEQDKYLIGACRLEWAGGEAYLRPLVVAQAWQRRGVGHRLVEKMLDRTETVKVVARGRAAVFYTRLGFQPLSWETIHLAYQDECHTCPDRQACQPVPMCYQANLPGCDS